MAPDRRTGRGRAVGKKALTGAGCIAAASLLVAAVSAASFHPRGHTAARATTVQNVAVGPKGSPAGAALPTPAGPGATGQLVSSVAASTSAVRYSAVGPAYDGTEPGTMTLVRHGRELVVTVVPQ